MAQLQTKGDNLFYKIKETKKKCNIQIGFDQKTGAKLCGAKAAYIELFADKNQQVRCELHRPPKEEISLAD